MSTTQQKEAILNGLPLLAETDQRRWLVEHIPHRIRAVLPGIHMTGEWNTDWPGEPEVGQIVWRCMANAIWEGRLTAMRWLLFFVGLSADRNRKPSRPIVSEPQHDIFITRFTGGTGQLYPWGPEAERLALVWCGCSKATSHPTDRTNHPPLGEKELADAMALVIAHLQRTIYSAAGKRLIDLTRTMKSPNTLLAEW